MSSEDSESEFTSEKEILPEIMLEMVLAKADSAEEEISLAIERLDSWLLERPDLYPYLKRRVEGIQIELKSMLDFLTEKFEEGKTFNYLKSDAAEMAQIAVDTIAYPPSRNFNRKIESIRNGLRETKKRMLQFGVEGSAPSRTVGEGDECVVGLEEDVALLLHEGLHTSCIVGMCGIGKTTLARKLYGHPAVVGEFECRAWICVSSELSRKEVLMKLIQQAGSEVFEKGDELMEILKYAGNRNLRLFLLQLLQGVPNFIVLDDVGDSTYFESIIEDLRQENGNRLLLTSRTRNIKTRVDYFHEMKFLDNDRSWKLFLKTVNFGNMDTSDDHKFPKHLAEKARDVLRKCDGLPLAIKDVGRQLAVKKRAGGEWEELLKSVDLSATLAALEPSYHKLRSKVKPFFLFLGFFKRGATIKIEKLKQIWNAGIVDEEEDEEEYNSYLQELMDECLVEVKDTCKDDQNKSCRVNAVLHRLSVIKAEKEMRFEILRSNGNNRSFQKPRHRAIYCSREKFNHSTDQDKHLLSLFFYGGGYFDANDLSYWKHFELLRILDFEGFGLKMLPETVGALTELRYLGLRNNYIQELPKSLGRLKKLEVLDIALNFMVEVPDIIWEMSSLCHLYMSDIVCRKPLTMHTLVNLETLTSISVDNWRYELSSLQMMTSLRKLGIEELDDNSDVNKLFASLAELKNLDCLILRGFRFKSMRILEMICILKRLTKLKLDGVLTRLPSVNSFPPHMTYLTLFNSSLDEDPMPQLGKLSYLFYLHLRNAYIGHQMVIPDKGFPVLRILCIEEMWHLRDIQEGVGSLPWLQQSTIINCPYLHNVSEETS